MTRFHYLLLGYALIWIAIGVYLFLMNRRITRVRDEIEELQGWLNEKGE